jgi:hypothetical protein
MVTFSPSSLCIPNRWNSLDRRLGRPRAHLDGGKEMNVYVYMLASCVPGRGVLVGQEIRINDRGSVPVRRYYHRHYDHHYHA